MPSNNPVLSIILPAYNAEKYIGEAIDSIIGQSFTDFELIIADDGSIDNTRKIIDSYSDGRIIKSHNERNNGKTVTVNRLFKLCKGEFITIHDADDTSLPNRFERQLKEFHENDKLIMCGTWFQYVSQNLKPFKKIITPTTYDEVKSTILKQSAFHGPTVMVKKEIITTLDEFLRPFFQDYNEDCDFNIRLVERGMCYNIPEYLYQYRLLPFSLSKSLTPRKRVSYQIVTYLANQREQHGKDDLQLNNFKNVESLVTKLCSKYLNDPSLINREQAEFYMYFNFTKEAIISSLDGIKKSPLNLNNYRTLQYCLRRKLIGI